MAQLDRESSERTKIETLLRELLDSKRNRKSEQLSVDQLVLFAAAGEARQAAAEAPPKTRRMTKIQVPRGVAAKPLHGRRMAAGKL